MPLATIDQLKEYVGGDEKDDDLLTRLVTAASDAIENYCGRTFGSTNFTSELYSGTGTHVLTLRNFPIIAVTSILEAGSVLTTGTDAQASQVIIHSETGQLVRPWFIWLPYFDWYSISYSAGYATVPASIVQACVELSGLMLRDKEHIGIAQKTSGTQTTTYLRELSAPTRRAMDGYSELALGRST